MILLAACSADDALMQRPDIDEATRQYRQAEGEVLRALSDAIPRLASWQPGSVGGRAACGAEYPGADGVTYHFDSKLVPGALSDADYERALTIIGSVIKGYGFNPVPQRLYDAPGSHDAIFHNVHDDGEVFFGTGENTSVRLSVGCHLTAAAKRRG